MLVDSTPAFQNRRLVYPLQAAPRPPGRVPTLSSYVGGWPTLSRGVCQLPTRILIRAKGGTGTMDFFRPVKRALLFCSRTQGSRPGLHVLSPCRAGAVARGRPAGWARSVALRAVIQLSGVGGRVSAVRGWKRLNIPHVAEGVGVPRLALGRVRSFALARDDSN